SGTPNFRAVEKRILDTIIGHGNYDSRIRPSGNNTGNNNGKYKLNR
ncbi:glutamate-gated chloride channel-like protein, partial [Leptotrombidium deliense]